MNNVRNTTKEIVLKELAWFGDLLGGRALYLH